MRSRDPSHAQPPSDALSPSLNGRGSPDQPPAYEFKFVLDAEGAAAVEGALRQTLEPDPHADPILDGAYAITSIYSDTPSWSVYFREGWYRNRKFRIRRYGRSPEVYLERKTVRSNMVRKQRVPIEQEALPRLADVDPSWAGAWFARGLAARGLVPVCRIRYQRRAFFGACSEGPMRVTFDRAIRGGLLPRWSLDDSIPEVPLLSDHVICEFKFRGSMPTPMKRVAAKFRLDPRGVSKYRACIGAFHAALALPAPQGGEDTDA